MTAAARDRYDRYADIFEDPETAESIEVGRRVLHGMFMEAWSPGTAHGVITDRAREAARSR